MTKCPKNWLANFSPPSLSACTCMSTMNAFPFIELPVELQCEIFIQAARFDHANALRLVLVARRVHSWVQPEIYNMVTLGSKDTTLFIRTMESIPPDFFAVHVKTLCLSVSVLPKDAARILTVCTGVTQFAFWVDYLGLFLNNPVPDPTPSIVSLISPLPLRRLSIELRLFLSLFTESGTYYPWCDSLTHLDIIFWETGLQPNIPPLKKLSSLTHLALRLRHNHAEESSIFRILSDCKRLRILLIFDEMDASEEIWSGDPRVAYLPYPFKIIEDWEAQARGESSSTWCRAEELVKNKAAELERDKHLKHDSVLTP